MGIASRGRTAARGTRIRSAVSAPRWYCGPLSVQGWMVAVLRASERLKQWDQSCQRMVQAIGEGVNYLVMMVAAARATAERWLKFSAHVRRGAASWDHPWVRRFQ